VAVFFRRNRVLPPHLAGIVPGLARPPGPQPRTGPELGARHAPCLSRVLWTEPAREHDCRFRDLRQSDAPAVFSGQRRRLSATVPDRPKQRKPRCGKRFRRVARKPVSRLIPPEPAAIHARHQKPAPTASWASLLPGNIQFR
jgi:hypothetical protein